MQDALDAGDGGCENIKHLLRFLDLDVLGALVEEFEELWVFRLHLHLLLGRAITMSEHSDYGAQLPVLLFGHLGFILLRAEGSRLLPATLGGGVEHPLWIGERSIKLSQYDFPELHGAILIVLVRRLDKREAVDVTDIGFTATS